MGDITHLKDAITKAITYIEKDELPPLWDRDSIFNMGGASSESGKPGTGKSGETEGETNKNRGPRPPSHFWIRINFEQFRELLMIVFFRSCVIGES